MKSHSIFFLGDTIVYPPPTLTEKNPSLGWGCKYLCCGHTCAVKQRAAKNNTWDPMGKFYSALLDAVKQRLLKSSCSIVTKMTMFTKAVDVFHKLFKAASSRLAFSMELQAAGAAQV